MKFQPSFADQGDPILLKPKQTKDRHVRIIKVRAEEQRDVFNRARLSLQ